MAGVVKCKAAALGKPLIPYSYTNNRRDGFSYDAAGNLTNDLGQTFTYDATGQQTYASYMSVEQSYDGDGLRVKKVENGTTTYYLRSTVLGGQVVAELDAYANWTRGYVYQGSGLLAVQQGSAVYWMHEDPITKSKRTTDGFGNMVSAIELDPWGADTNRSWNPAFQPKKFTSYERDANGSDEAMFRRYNRWHSRFDQPDPYPGSYDLSDPQSFNRYAYVDSDPINLTDPNGLDPISSARALLKNGSCRGLFGSINPINLLNRLVSQNHIRPSNQMPTAVLYRGRRFVGFAGFQSFGTAGMVTVDAALHPPLSGPERNPYIFMSNAFVTGLASGQQYGGEYSGLSSEAIGGVSLIHELLHAAGRIPKDGGNTPLASCCCV